MIEDVGGATVITGEHIELYKLLSMRGALHLQTKGLKLSKGRSIVLIVKAQFPQFHGRTAKVVLKQLEDYIEQKWPGAMQERYSK